ncbi:LPS O-antigen chain length determinant protein WzzB [Pseudomonas sp. TMP9]|uniref:LPS O-antigen chain length determinant protein WzzB n=1 Tax=Pseudomonas sp. TMP9 TaxID=3133144 RepID=UPI0030D49CC6
MTEQTYQRQANDDEIDLVELFQSLWAQKWLIVFITLVFAVAAASYAYLSKPVYQASAAVLPPSLSDIAGFNLGRTGADEGGLKPFLVDDVYVVFVGNLQSDKSRRKFFKEFYLPSLEDAQRVGSQDNLYKAFNEKFSIKATDKTQPDRYSIVVEHHKPDSASALVKQYIDQVSVRSLEDVLQNGKRELAVQARNIEQQIKSGRNSAKIRRDDRTKQLKEALTVADAIGLDNPPVVNTELSAFMDGSLMYMRGAKSLRAEMEVLQARVSNDPFIPGLRDLEAKYQLLTEVSIDRSNVAVFRQDGEIGVPDQPIKPKKALIVALGIVLGGMLGMFIALIRVMLIKHTAKVK